MTVNDEEQVDIYASGKRQHIFFCLIPRVSVNLDKSCQDEERKYNSSGGSEGAGMACVFFQTLNLNTAYIMITFCVSLISESLKVPA